MTTAVNREQAAARLVQHLFENENSVRYAEVDEAAFAPAMAVLAAQNAVLIGLFCAERFEGRPGFTLFCVFENRGSSNILVVQRSLKGAQATSVAMLFPSACWFEREIRDGFGVEFADAFDKRPLFLHEGYEPGFHPLLKSFKNGEYRTRQAIPAAEEYRFKQVTGEGVYEVPVGPVHAGIIEPGHFRFSVIGETVFNLEVRMFYKHRGIEKLAEGRAPAGAVNIAETISGDESAANAAAFCMAIERIAGATVPRRAWQLRTVLLEMERVYSHLSDLAGMTVDVAYAVGASRLFVLREEALRHNEALTGSRFLKGILCPGGLRRDIPAAVLQETSRFLDGLLRRFNDALDLINSTSSVIDRFQTTGVVPGEIIPALNITGPAARAAGVAIDTRLDHPYGLYAETPLRKRVLEAGDVLCRFNLKAQEVFDSARIIQQMAAEAVDGPVCATAPVRDGYALAMVEAPRGQTLHWVYVKDGLIDRYKVRTASFCNWQAIEHAVLGNIVPDFPLINKSLNLSYAGTDL